ncbi:bifunctional riboflavin kinase/FAD synthetase [Lacibacterium aquatile]|uniref:Riboflavin biosynthesis protein n=1 Tax=Lacibacterium aquatile TaxID=1168082 RepID=A0ABW5DNZ8_9PROT
MFVSRDPFRLPTTLRGATLVLGNFDGIHPGHQAVISAAKAVGAKTIVVTFEPHPRRLFRPDTPPFRLTPPGPKLRALQAQGIDGVIALRFNRRLAAMSAEDFVNEILVRALGAGHVVVGEDFCFGQSRQGNLASLRADGRFRVTGVPAIATHGTIFSSTEIRTLLSDGRPDEAARLLGHPFTIEGHVRHGDKRGRTIGFPTANIGLGSYIRPKFGVYAVRVPGVGQGVANLGRRPTFGGFDDRLEVHLFDFSGDLYGRRLQVQLVSFLRQEQKFDGLDALKAQIALDAAEARHLLAR